MLIKNSEYVTKKISHEKNLYKKVILENGLIKGLLQFAISEFEKGVVIKPHSHKSMSEVFYILEGRIQITKNERNYIGEKGDTFYFKSNEIHELTVLEKTRILYFNLEDD